MICRVYHDGAEHTVMHHSIIITRKNNYCGLWWTYTEFNTVIAVKSVCTHRIMPKTCNRTERCNITPFSVCVTNCTRIYVCSNLRRYVRARNCLKNYVCYEDMCAIVHVWSINLRISTICTIQYLCSHQFLHISQGSPKGGLGCPVSLPTEFSDNWYWANSKKS